jgi:hypothetical protein
LWNWLDELRKQSVDPTSFDEHSHIWTVDPVSKEWQLQSWLYPEPSDKPEEPLIPPRMGW